MATTRLMPLHTGKGRTVGQAISDIIDYTENPQKTDGGMSKRGSPYLRKCIWMASQVAVQCDPMFRAYYEKKAAEGLKYMTIIGHVTRKMTAVVFAILRDNKIYKPILPTAA